jgi:hypothetical protein
MASREDNDNDIPLFSRPMDNVFPSAGALADIVQQVENALQIKYTQNLLNKCLQQQQEGCNSQGRVYSHSPGSRAASMGNQHTAPAANLHNYLPPELRQQQIQPRNDYPAHSSNEPP